MSGTVVAVVYIAVGFVIVFAAVGLVLPWSNVFYCRASSPWEVGEGTITL